MANVGAVPDSVHLGDCRMAGKNADPLGRDEGRQALSTGRVRACAICRPFTLGLLDS
ncbi:DUF6233 domain-containing protein [Streptomyces wedmorensis]|uniref:DUF6233 domain-containing protein n=1 Tax=Streptomyces wedmorensis TaxID=43759 RepID=UPI00342E9F46